MNKLTGTFCASGFSKPIPAQTVLACVYIEIEWSEIKLVAALQTLPESLYVPLDEKLTELRQEQ
jgi:hypothetical protein